MSDAISSSSSSPASLPDMEDTRDMAGLRLAHGIMVLANADFIALLTVLPPDEVGRDTKQAVLDLLERIERATFLVTRDIKKLELTLRPAPD